MEEDDKHLVEKSLTLALSVAPCCNIGRWEESPGSPWHLAQLKREIQQNGDLLQLQLESHLPLLKESFFDHREGALSPLQPAGGSLR